MRSWIEISRKAWRDNWNQIGSLIPSVKIIPIIKANAYGHGLLAISKLIEETDCEIVGVDSLEEARILRKQAFTKKLLILGFVPVSQFHELSQLDGIELCLFNTEQLQYIEEKHYSFGLHIPIETGLCREGFTREEVGDLLQRMKKTKSKVVGLYQHFSNIEDVDDREVADKQLRQFQVTLGIIHEYIDDSVCLHASASGAALAYTDMHFDYCRIGIAQYGLWPSKNIQERTHVSLTPVLRWKCRIATLKYLKKGEYISYGQTERLTRDSHIAILPIGYSDGLDRVSLSSKGSVLIRGQRCKILGRICMNMTVVDVTDLAEVTLQDEVTLIGKQGNEEITAQELADFSGTIHYEIVTRLREGLPRVLVD